MTRTNTAERKVKNYHEHYPTPSWCVQRFLEMCELPHGFWLEPAVGDGAIVRAVNSIRSDIIWTTNDLKCWGEFTPDFTEDFIWMGCPEIQGQRPFRGWDVCITNPPFSLAMDFINVAFQMSQVVVMLLRLDWLGSAERRDWLHEHNPDLYILPDRPSFDGKGADSCFYAWYVWGSGRGGRHFLLEKTDRRYR
jgi:hypothetical protein